MRSTPHVIRVWTIGWLLAGMPIAICAEDSKEPREQWIVVTAPAFGDAVRPLREFRRQQGMHVATLRVAAGESPDALRNRIHTACRGWEGASYVLLVGMPHPVRVVPVDAGAPEHPDRVVVPALKGTLGNMQGRPTDNGYGCWDDSMVPSVAVGRFPARTRAEAEAMVVKTLAWETEQSLGAWKRHVTILAGAPSFNPTVDAIVEKLAMSHFARLDPAWTGRAIYDNPTSRFALPEDELKPRALNYLRGGQAMIVYIGHSTRASIWSGELGLDEWGNLGIGREAGIFVTIGCQALEFGDEHWVDGYGLAAMRDRHGPVAVIGPTRRDSAAMAMLIAQGLLDNLPAPRESPRLADIWLAMLKHLARGYLNPIVFRVLDEVDGMPGVPADVQRRIHFEMFMLLGDPAIRIPAMPAEVSLAVAGQATPGATLTITGRAGAELSGARGLLTLERPITSEAPDLEPVPADVHAAESQRVLLRNHERSNSFIISRADITLNDQSFRHELELPDELRWPTVIVRLYLATDATDGMAVQAVRVTGPIAP